MLKLFILMLLILASSKGGYCLEHDGVEMISLEPEKDLVKVDDKLSDILKYCSTEPFGPESGRTTQAHETVHAINSHVRNSLFLKGRRNMNAFYCGKGKAVVVENPRLKIRHVSNFVPGVLRGSRYKLYFVDQLQHWDNTPTYLMDEWSAYVAGAEVGVEDFERGRPKEESDVVCGALEFSIYCVALCMATEEHDPAYWENDKRLRHSVKYYLIRAERVYFKGFNTFKFKKQDFLLNSLRFHEDAQGIRNFLLKEFDGIFLK